MDSSFQEKIAELIRYAFLEIRLLGRDGDARRAGELADVFHNVPTNLVRGTLDIERWKEEVIAYEKKYEGAERKPLPYSEYL